MLHWNCLSFIVLVSIPPSSLSMDVETRLCMHRIDSVLVTLSSLEETAKEHFSAAMTRLYYFMHDDIPPDEYKTTANIYIKLQVKLIGAIEKEKEVINEAYSILSFIRRHLQVKPRSYVLHPLYNRTDLWKNEFMGNFNDTIQSILGLQIVKEALKKPKREAQINVHKVDEYLEKYRQEKLLFYKSFLAGFKREETYADYIPWKF